MYSYSWHSSRRSLSFGCRSVLVCIIVDSARTAEKLQQAKTQPNDGKGENCSD